MWWDLLLTRLIVLYRHIISRFLDSCFHTWWRMWQNHDCEYFFFHMGSFSCRWGLRIGGFWIYKTRGATHSSTDIDMLKKNYWYVCVLARFLNLSLGNTLGWNSEQNQSRLMNCLHLACRIVEFIVNALKSASF